MQNASVKNAPAASNVSLESCECQLMREGLLRSGAVRGWTRTCKKFAAACIPRGAVKRLARRKQVTVRPSCAVRKVGGDGGARRRCTLVQPRQTKHQRSMRRDVCTTAPTLVLSAADPRTHPTPDIDLRSCVFGYFAPDERQHAIPPKAGAPKNRYVALAVATLTS